MPSKRPIYPLRMHPGLRKAITERAAVAGMSVNEFIEFALVAFIAVNTAQKLAARRPERPHVHHNAPCPCGSRERYRNCCRGRIAAGSEIAIQP